MKYLVMLSILVLSACSLTTEITKVEEEAKPTDLNQLVEKAIIRYPASVNGTFQFPIQTAESKDGVVYLYTHSNEKDPKNITVILAQSSIDAFVDIYGSSLESYFKGKTIEVDGHVKLNKVIPLKGGKHYYKTEIKVRSTDNLKVLNQV
ncbi:hypothetical protein GCM10008107_14310 [Psychrosphaera saromensis]|uniref:Lipoprotein n=1 Tax=Psychrosphaera saromensis TaxID=716813 RepID=A0A2S7UUD5_9GAMM|nr:hypothetical protein [Psychrosphaera saromensis]PQJ53338.1 hypothetical protein BTO11_06420 [Psychrosphaera saromensis]GHB66277.1 hypothetical protein GCM10008107_14310 [Psychrosphaera saromensis]GLQ14887.1 hypothetical protein GCM10007917_23420 [Psychrosphaera saromensis]